MGLTAKISVSFSTAISGLSKSLGFISRGFVGRRPKAVIHEYLRTGRSTGAFARASLFVGAILFCIIYGAAYALVAPLLLVTFAVPIAIMGMLVIWALPDMRQGPTKLLVFLFYAFLAAMIIWPNYLAVAIPGLPWITVLRLIGVPLAITFLVCVSVSKTFRTQIARALKSLPEVWILLLIFVTIQFVSLIFSKNKGLSIDRFIVAQLNWTMMFFISTYIFLRPGRVERVAGIMWGLAMFACALGLWEYKLEKLPWAGHVPSFLKINELHVAESLSSIRRLSGAYRVHTTWSNSLGMSEYLAMTIPFVATFLGKRYSTLIRCLAGISIPIMVLLISFTQARLGLVGGLIAMLGYIFAMAMRHWRGNKTSLLGPAFALSYPAVACLVIAATFFVGRIHNVIWGNGSQDSSNQARVDQYASGLPMVLKRPFGYGEGMGAITLDYHPFDYLTIDTYYLAIALEYGIFGFIIYYSMIMVTIYKSASLWLSAKQRDSDVEFLLPIASALTAFFVIKSVFSEENNHPLIYMMMGILAALLYRVRNAELLVKSPTIITNDVQAPVLIEKRKKAHTYISA